MTLTKKIIISAIIGTAFWCWNPPPSFRFNYLSAGALDIITATNSERQIAGLNILKISDTLNKVAELKVADMVKNNYFAHISPTQISPRYFFEEAGYDFRYAGENLAVDFTNNEHIVKMWMESPSHRDNILDPHYTEIGVAVLRSKYNGHLTDFVAQEFGKPQD